MASLSSLDMAGKLLVEGFKHAGPSATAFSAPLVETPMVVTLEELRPYNHNPRVRRNPAYDEIKASIRKRGLDAAPGITRRPGEPHYIIGNGGNTRLAILNELWTETRDERFFRIPSLFRPWPQRGEILMLTGHLAENELRGGLTFIERALGVEKAREFYEREQGQTLSQRELARLLADDGFPVQRSHVARMQDAIQFLLPAIPNILYGGLGRHQVERLAVLRRAAERTWSRRAELADPGVDFASVFHDVLAQFDLMPDGFSTQRVQDELVGQMAERLKANYDTLSLEIDECETRERALTEEPAAASSSAAAPAPVRPTMAPGPLLGTLMLKVAEPVTAPSVAPATAPLEPPQAATLATPAERDEPQCDRIQQQVISEAPSTARLESIQQMVAEELGEERVTYASATLRAIPMQAGGLYPITDIWHIDPGVDTPRGLRTHIAQFAREIASEAGAAECIEPKEDGIGFECVVPESACPPPRFARTVVRLLSALSELGEPTACPEQGPVADDLAQLLHGYKGQSVRLSDEALVKLFRLLRLARRLQDLDASFARMFEGL